MNDAAQDQQPALIDPSGLDESAFFLPPAQCRKRYTSEQVQGIEFKRDAILMLVGTGCPVETIARGLKLSIRTVAAIAAQASGKVAGFRKEYAAGLLAMGAEAFALAKTKQHDASYLQLMTGAGIATDKAVILSGMGEMAEEKIVKEEENHALVCAELRRLMAASDSQSGGIPSNDGPIVQDGAANGAGPGPAPEGAGGGSDRPALSRTTMDQPIVDLPPKD